MQPNKGSPFWRYLRWLIFSPFIVLVFTIGVLVHIYAYADFLVHGILFKNRLSKKGRIVSLKELKALVASGFPDGTLIEESYTLGWGVGRIWWTPDSISLDNASAETETANSQIERALRPQQQAIYDTYVDLENGKALLLKSWRFSETLKKVENLFPGISTVSLWSGAILAERSLNSKGRSLLEKATKGTDPSTTQDDGRGKHPSR